MTLRTRKVTYDRYLTKTCIKNLEYTFGTRWDNYPSSNIYIEYWSGRRFIGVVFGETYSDDEMYIDHFMISPKYRNKGYGTSIISDIKTKYRQLITESAVESVAFWKKQGFKRLKSQDNRIYSDTVEMIYKPTKK